MRRLWPLYLMMAVVLAHYLLFSYYPMYGIVLGFKDYSPRKGIWGSEWIGWTHFRKIFAAPEFFRAVKNTFLISALKLLFCFPIPILMSVCLEEMGCKSVKKPVQTIIYLPYFISWVIIGGLVKMLFATGDGLVNQIIVGFGGTRKEFLTTSSYFYFILIFATIWKEAGWGTIIYTAAMSGIDVNLYEAAEIDGCNRFKKIVYITLPSIGPIILMMFVLAVGNVMNAGFDPIFNLYNKTIYDVADIIDTYMYRIGMTDGNFEQATALGLFKNTINFTLLLGANFIVKRINGYGIYETAK